MFPASLRLPAARVLVFLSVLAYLGPVLAQGVTSNERLPGRDTLPNGVVLVVNLVSRTHVKPTTGVVVSNEGLVLIPAAFVSQGDEIVVMDGGGSLARNGRRSRVIHRDAGAGLAILKVDGLEQDPIPLAAEPGRNGAQLRLGAFPPAEELSKGTGPMWLPAELSANVAGGIYGISPNTRIPNVTGPLFNHCGQWIGYALADGTPSMSSDLPPIVAFTRDIRSVLAGWDIELVPRNCAGEVVTEQIPPEPMKIDPPVIEQEAILPVTQDPASESQGETGEDPVQTELEPVQEKTPEPEKSVWPWLLLGLLMTAAFTVFGLRLLKRRDESPQDPDTQVLLDLTESGQAIADPGARQLVLEPVANTSLAVPPVVVLDSTARSFTLGRKGSDLEIMEDGISRVHARLGQHGTGFTLEDMGSLNGTFLNGAACLEGEIFYLEPGDQIALGPHEYRLYLKQAQEMET